MICPCGDRRCRYFVRRRRAELAVQGIWDWVHPVVFGAGWNTDHDFEDTLLEQRRRARKAWWDHLEAEFAVATETVAVAA